MGFAKESRQNSHEFPKFPIHNAPAKKVSDSRSERARVHKKTAIPREGPGSLGCATEMIRENQAIRANLRIDSRESGHLRLLSSTTHSMLLFKI